MLKDYTVAEIRDAVKNKKVYSHSLLQALLSDHRVGVRKIGEKLQREMEARQKQFGSFRKMQKFDQDYVLRFGEMVAGVDEAGRGPLAGPVVAAAVIISPRAPLYGVEDSKKMTPKERGRLFCLLHKYSRDIGVGVIGPGEIDSLNIHRASEKAMRLAISRMANSPDLFLIDGNQSLPRVMAPQKTIKGGDGKSLSIAAASIVAKVLRDWIMDCLDRDFPEYGWKENRGYGTSGHLKALEKNGLSPYHRESFAPVRQTGKKGGNLFG